MPEILEFDPRGEEMSIEDPYAQHNLLCARPQNNTVRHILMVKEIRELRKDLRHFMRVFALFNDREVSRCADLPSYVEPLSSASH